MPTTAWSAQCASSPSSAATTPGRFTLVPFGGAGPLHGCALAELLGIARLLVKPAPGILCADGLLAAELRAEFSRALPRAGDAAAAAPILAALLAQAEAWLDAERVPTPDRSTRAVALMRYRGQGTELAVPWAESQDVLAARFHDAHRALYGFALASPVELVTLRIEASGAARSPAQPPLAEAPTPEPLEHIVLALPEGRRSVPVIDRARLGAGATLAGPASSPSSTRPRSSAAAGPAPSTPRARSS